MLFHRSKGEPFPKPSVLGASEPFPPNVYPSTPIFLLPDTSTATEIAKDRPKMDRNASIYNIHVYVGAAAEAFEGKQKGSPEWVLRLIEH